MGALGIKLLIVGLFWVCTWAFVTSSANIELEERLWEMTCPLPIYDGIATLDSIDGLQLIYDVDYGNGTSLLGTYFECYVDDITENLAATATIKEYGATFFDVIPIGNLGFIADTLTALGGKFASMVYAGKDLFITPEITLFGQTEDLTALVAVNIAMFGLIGFGIWDGVIVPMRGGGS